MKKFLKLATAFIAALLVLVACAGGGGKSSAGGEDAKKTLYFIPIVDIGAYWNPMRLGAEETAKSLAMS